jgi:hypothetical protein
LRVRCEGRGMLYDIQRYSSKDGIGTQGRGLK